MKVCVTPGKKAKANEAWLGQIFPLNLSLKSTAIQQLGVTVQNTSVFLLIIRGSRAKIIDLAKVFFRLYSSIVLALAISSADITSTMLTVV